MTLKDLISDFKFWLAAVVLVAGIVVGFIKYQNLPVRIEKVETKVEVQKDNVQKLAGTVDMFITEQRVIQREQSKREDLMLKLIDKTK